MMLRRSLLHRGGGVTQCLRSMSQMTSSGGGSEEDKRKFFERIIKEDKFKEFEELQKRWLAETEKLEDSPENILTGLQRREFGKMDLLDKLKPEQLKKDVELSEQLLKDPSDFPEFQLFERLIEKFPELKPLPPVMNEHGAALEVAAQLEEAEAVEEAERLARLKAQQRHDMIREYDVEELKTVLPEGFPSWGQEQQDFLGTRALVWRRLGQELRARMLKLKEDKFPASQRSTIIDGPRGVGKTATLVQLVVWARENGWLVLYLDACELLKGGRIVRNKQNPKMWDQWNTANSFCEKALDGGRDIYASEKLKAIGMEIEGFERTDDSTILDLLQYGVDHQQFSCDVATWFRTEIGLITNVPVLIAIDNFNAFQRESNYMDMDSEKFKPPFLPVDQLTLPRLFRDHKTHGLVNGTSILAMSRTNPMTMKKWETDHKHDQKTRAQVQQQHPLTLDEVDLLCDYWNTKNNFVSDRFGEFSRKYAHAYSAGRPQELWNYLLWQ